MQIHALYFHVQPLSAPDDRDVFLVVWPERDGNGRWCHHAHPDHTVMDAEFGDVLVHKRTAYRVRAVKVYRSSLCRDETQHDWCGSVRECLSA